MKMVNQLLLKKGNTLPQPYPKVFKGKRFNNNMKNKTQIHTQKKSGSDGSKIRMLQLPSLHTQGDKK